MAEAFQKVYNRNEEDNEQYMLKSYWTSSQTVEFSDGSNLEEYKTALGNKIGAKGDTLSYDVDTGIISLSGNGTELSSDEMRVNVSKSVELGDVENPSVQLSGTNVRIVWNDPLDVTFSEMTLCEWAGTKVVRKVGSIPQNVSDGTLIVNNTTRNQYASNPYIDQNISSEVYYYYRFFPYDSNNEYYGKTCCIVFRPADLVSVNVPTAPSPISYTGETITPTFTGYDSTKMTVSGDTSATEVGNYTAIFAVKPGYMWSDGTVARKRVSWSIE